MEWSPRGLGNCAEVQGNATKRYKNRQVRLKPSIKGLFSYKKLKRRGGEVPKQRRLTDKERAEVSMDYASGKRKSEIAKKFKISPTAISKILEKYKSSKIGKKVQSKSSKTQRELRQDIIAKATEGLYYKVTEEPENLPAETLLKIIERLSLIDNNNKDGSELKIIVEKKIVDLTAKDGDNASD